MGRTLEGGTLWSYRTMILSLVSTSLLLSVTGIVDAQCHDGIGEESGSDRLANVRQLRENSVKRASMFKKYDFIIVGASPSGCLLANRLSEVADWSVLLIEAGEIENLFVQIPIFSAFLQSTSYNWGFLAEPQNYSCWGMKDQRCSYPRGKGLGGSTLINYMMYVRGNKYDYDQWASSGNPGWSYDEILPYFKKSEKSYLPETSNYHGQNGNLDVRHLPYRTRLAQLFVNSWQELGLDAVDYNGESQIGVSYVQSNVRNGRRLTAYTAFLEPIQDRPNLHILTNARATKILIDPHSKAAYGVEFLRDRTRYAVYSEKEILMTAGALQTPQLLMLSGVGPREHLQELGIPVIKSLPVGQTLYDHVYFTGLAFVTNTTNLSLHGDNVITLEAFLRFLQGRGPMTVTGGVEALAFIRNVTENGKTPVSLPNLEYIVTGGSQAADRGSGIRSGFRLTDNTYNIYKPLETNERDALTVNIVLLHPKSRGYMRLKSCNPLHWPRFYSNMLKEDEDVETILRGIRAAMPLVQTKVARRFNTKLYDVPLPNCAAHRFGTDDYWRCAIRTQTTSIHHQMTTCKMGPVTDSEAVVSSELRVYGIERLRVGDVGIIPYPTSGHPAATAYMIGEKLSDMVKRTWLGRNAPTAGGGTR
ncbi:glucose dehydrogenase [Anopheles darlingi]|uniref:Glucose dehydrogenase n=1 Tax=Anopheles darlingi TaxID=43151 RepID=W5JAQ1_ANODA|nr:glucose dehydrogenase [Anopheles darlingi]